MKRRGALPLEDALNIGKQICEAMEAAHEKGIIHRDLKPANVKVDPQGKVKVLDFGLAKSFAPQHAKEGLSNSPTLSMQATNAGVILGTASYMSPEQARGRNVDRRTDIWAFGCVLYEMLTGKQVFRGEDVTEILASVVKTEPDWQALPPGIPSNIRTLLFRCLQKDIKKRIRDAGDIAIELEHALSTPSTLVEAAPPKAATWRGRSLFIASVGLLIGGIIAGIAAWRVKPAPAVPVSRMTITLPLSQRLSGFNLNSIAFSPDGKRLVFVGRSDVGQQLYVRGLDSWQAKPLPGTEGATDPFFSPDGQWIAFFTWSNLKKIPIAGGPAVTLAFVGNARGGSWGSDGNIVFAPGPTSGLYLVSSSGGAVRTLTAPDSGNASYRFPHHLADTNAVLFTVGTGGTWDDAKIELLRLDTGEKKVLIDGGSDGRYVPTGHLVYLRAGTLMAVRFNLRGLEVSGSAVPLVEGVLASTDNTGSAQASISDFGSLAYVSGDRNALARTLLLIRLIQQDAIGSVHAWLARRFPRRCVNFKRILQLRKPANGIWPSVGGPMASFALVADTSEPMN